METVSNLKDAFRIHEIEAMFQSDHAIVRYRGTDIVTFDDAEIILSAGGVRDRAVKSRINQAAEYHALNYHLFQRGANWYVETPAGPTIEFSDGVKFKRVTGSIPAAPMARPAHFTKDQMSKVIDSAFKAFPSIDRNGADAKAKLYTMELREVQRVRAGKKRPSGFGDSLAAKFLAVKHVYDVLRGESKYNLEDALDLPHSVIYACALVMSQKEDFATLMAICDSSNFKAISYEAMNK